MNRLRLQSLSCWYLSGPTASGKTKVGIALARRLGAEIISLDSMAIYRDMDIGTAKPTDEELGGVPIHLINIVDPSEEYSLARYIAAAHEKITEIHNRGRRAIFIGGTPLYLKGMLRGIFEGPPANKEFRAELERKMQGRKPEFLHKTLKKVDPISAKRLHPNDIRRLVRALEVYELTGRPISEFQKQFENGVPAEDCNVYVLQWPRDVLYARIDKRVDTMMYDGFLDEVKRLTERKLPISQTARQALGYRELLDYLDGKLKFAQAVDLIKQNTRNFAKRQETWFRSLAECRFIPGDAPKFELDFEETDDENEQPLLPDVDDE